MQLPPELRAALDHLSANIPAADLTRAAQEISDAYRDRRFSTPVLSSKAHRVAYLNVRMPATYVANAHVFAEVSKRLQHHPVKSLLDLGSGPGTASLAALSYFHFERVTCVERDAELIQFGQTFLQSASFIASDLNAAPLQEADLVVLSYSLGELRDQSGMVGRAWDSARVALAVIEPGTPAGFQTVLKAREHLIASGAKIIAPCPHHGRCGMALRDDWCHFSARVERTALHRQMKGADLGHEDEKFSYVVASKLEAPQADARIVRHPMKHSGHVQLTLCVPPENIEKTTVTRSQKDLYKGARKAEWGDPWPPDSLHPPG